MKGNLKDMTLQEVKDLCSSNYCNSCPLRLNDNGKPYNYCVFMRNVQDTDIAPSDIKVDFPIHPKPLTKEQLYFLYGAYMMGAQYIMPPHVGDSIYKCRVDIRATVTTHQFFTPEYLEFEKVFFPYKDGAILIEDLLKAGGMIE